MTRGLSVFALMACFLSLSVFSQALLRAPSAPFPVMETAETSSEVRCEFRSSGYVYHFGAKKVTVFPDGTFQFCHDGRKLASMYFFFATPYRYWQTNERLAMRPQYDGGDMCLTGIEADEAGKTLTLSGVLPFHRQGTKPPLTGTWRMQVQSRGGNRLGVSLETGVPTGQRISDQGIFLRLENALGIRTPKGRFVLGKDRVSGGGGTRLEVLFPRQTDGFSVTSKGGEWGVPEGKRFLRFTQYGVGKAYELEFDLGVCPRESSPVVGGVDFQKNDCLSMPTRNGRNLLLNPYFAQGWQFYNLISAFAESAEPRAVLDEKDSVFGRYSMHTKARIGYVMPSPVPADPGTYTFSFYAKGRGHYGIRIQGARLNWQTKEQQVYVYSNVWTRRSITFKTTRPDAISLWLAVNPDKGQSLHTDGLQLERGAEMTAFDAAPVTARLVTNPPDGFLESSRPFEMDLEFTTLLPRIQGKAQISVRDFDRQTIHVQRYDFSVEKGQYPRCRVELPTSLSDGIYVLEVSYRLSDGSELREHFRFSRMPFLRNRHRTKSLFSPLYTGSSTYKDMHSREDYGPTLARWRAIGFGAHGHSPLLSRRLLDLYAEYGVLPFGGGAVQRKGSVEYAKVYPSLPVKAGHTYFYVHDPKGGVYSDVKGLCPDYRLVPGGWNEAYRKRFMTAVATVIGSSPEKFAYGMGAEFPPEIKDDPHYVDLFVAFAEAVKGVYPKAKVFEGGYCDMEPRGGTVMAGKFLKRIKGRWNLDYLATHVYTKDLTQLYRNFQEFVKMVDSCGFGQLKLAFPEGGHIFPYVIPAWNIERIGWMGGTWNAGALSYDLGWNEKIMGALYARLYLVFLTEFERVICVTSSAENITSGLYMDLARTPRSTQKTINTLGVLLGNPKRYVGNFTFAPDTKCLVWEDEQGCPLAVVWNEDRVVENGLKSSPYAVMDYKGAVYRDLMGVRRRPEVDGRFPVSPFPLFIQGRKGDMATFVQSISKAVLQDVGKVPFRIVDALVSPDTLQLNLVNDLSRQLTGTLTVVGQRHSVVIKPLGTQTLTVRLKEPVAFDRITKLSIPIVCEVDGNKVIYDFQTSVFAVKSFKGNWNQVPSIRITNHLSGGTGEKMGYEGDFEARCQVAWDKEYLHLRVSVKDDVFQAGDLPVNRYSFDAVQVYMDTRCSARKNGTCSYDDDDYDYTLMPTKDGKNCQVWRAVSPDIQLTLGIAAPPNNVIASEIPATFERTSDGYVYTVRFPADYILPARLVPGWNMGFALMVNDRDHAKKEKQHLSMATKQGSGCFNRPHLWPQILLVE